MSSLGFKSSSGVVGVLVELVGEWQPEDWEKIRLPDFR